MNPDYEKLRRALAQTAPPATQPPPGFRRAGVCLPLFDRNETKLLAIQKADTEGYPWRNQIALPGGHVGGQDRSITDTALRELDEELGIGRSDITVLGHLGHFQTATSKTDLGVIVGHWNARTAPRTDAREIARVLEIPLSELVEAHTARGFRSQPIRQIGDALAYPYQDLKIWGVTARILYHFLELLLDPIFPSREPLA